MTTTPAPFDSFKATQREVWSNFALNEGFTTPPAAALVQFANVSNGQKVLDVACGTAVVAVTAARLGATVTGLDLTPTLLERARENAAIANVEVELIEGDGEKLPFPDDSFDAVLSQFGHIFAPRPELATAEMLRVLKPGGRIAFTTWPPEHETGQLFALLGRYMPPPPDGAPKAAPPNYGATRMSSVHGSARRSQICSSNAAAWYPRRSVRAIYSPFWNSPSARSNAWWQVYLRTRSAWQACARKVWTSSDVVSRAMSCTRDI